MTRDTDRLPPPLSKRANEDTGPVSQHDHIKFQAANCIRDAFDQLAETQVALELAEFKTHQALGMAADSEAARVPTRLERLEEKVDRILSLAEELTNSRLEDHQNVIRIDAKLNRHIRRDAHGDELQLDVVEAQEG